MSEARYVGASEFARLCGVSRQTVYKWIAKGKVTTAGDGDSVKILVTDDVISNVHRNGGRGDAGAVNGNGESYGSAVNGNVSSDGVNRNVDGNFIDNSDGNIYNNSRRQIDADAVNKLIEEVRQRDQELIDTLRAQVEELKIDKRRQQEVLDQTLFTLHNIQMRIAAPADAQPAAEVVEDQAEPAAPATSAPSTQDSYRGPLTAFWDAVKTMVKR